MRVAQIASVLVLGMTLMDARAQQTDKQEQTKNEKVVVEGKPTETALAATVIAT